MSLYFGVDFPENAGGIFQELMESGLLSLSLSSPKVLEKFAPVGGRLVYARVPLLAAMVAAAPAAQQVVGRPEEAAAVPGASAAAGEGPAP